MKTKTDIQNSRDTTHWLRLLVRQSEQQNNNKMNITIHAPQLILLILIVINFAIHCAKRGEDRGEYNPVIYSLDAIATLALLYWGGFFA